MKLTDYMAEALSKEVQHAFVGNGGVVIHILDSLDRHPGVSVIPCENEQGASLAAEAYARVNKNLGLAIATSSSDNFNAVAMVIPLSYFSARQNIT